MQTGLGSGVEAKAFSLIWCFIDRPAKKSASPSSNTDGNASRPLSPSSQVCYSLRWQYEIPSPLYTIYTDSSHEAYKHARAKKQPHTNVPFPSRPIVSELLNLGRACHNASGCRRVAPTHSFGCVADEKGALSLVSQTHGGTRGLCRR